MARRRGRIAGITEMRARVRQIPRNATTEFVKVMNESGLALRDAMRARAKAQMKARTGRLFEGIRYEVRNEGGAASRIKLLVGLIGVKPGRNDLFYARIQDLGRKEQKVRYRRLKIGAREEWRARILAGKASTRFKPADLLTKYKSDLQNVPYMAPKRFVTGRYTALRRELNANLAAAYAAVVAEALKVR